MKLKFFRKLWLPYFVAAMGTILSFILWYVLRYDVEPYHLLLTVPKEHTSSIAFLIGVGFSLLIATITATSQLARQQARTLKKTNINLKKEIAERVQAEATKQKLEVALQQGQKLQAIGTLAGGIAHDFNNILYAIIGYIELARQDVPQDSLVYKNLGKVLDGAHRGQDLIARILAFSRRQHPKLTNINLTATIEAALTFLRHTIPTSVIILFEPIEAFIQGNKTLIHQVFVNIINNAVDAMDGEGTIHIKMTQVLAGSHLLKQFPGILPQNYYKIEIRDTGHGIDQFTAERIFEPFFTTKDVGKGTGLGLSIVHTIIKEHNGEITVNSELGQGTTFMILLPAEDPMLIS